MLSQTNSSGHPYVSHLEIMTWAGNLKWGIWMSSYSEFCVPNYEHTLHIKMPQLQAVVLQRGTLQHTGMTICMHVSPDYLEWFKYGRLKGQEEAKSIIRSRLSSLLYVCLQFIQFSSLVSRKKVIHYSWIPQLWWSTAVTLDKKSQEWDLRVNLKQMC